MTIFILLLNAYWQLRAHARNRQTCPGGPELFAQLPACDHLAWLFDQGDEHVKRLGAEPYPDTLPTQFAGACIQIEAAEPDGPGGSGSLRVPARFPHKNWPVSKENTIALRCRCVLEPGTCSRNHEWDDEFIKPVSSFSEHRWKDQIFTLPVLGLPAPFSSISRHRNGNAVSPISPNPAT